MRLIRKSSTRLLGQGEPEVFEGDTATAVLDSMQRSDPYFSAMTPEGFRASLLNASGADPGPNASDEEFLRAIVEVNPYLTLDEGISGPLSRLIR